MPYYKYKCSNCGKIFDKYFHLEDYQKEVICHYCGGIAHRVYGGIAIKNNSFRMQQLRKYGEKLDKYRDKDRKIKQKFGGR